MGRRGAQRAESRRVERTVKTRYVPLVALGAAYSFLVMMLNVPIPGHVQGRPIVALSRADARAPMSTAAPRRG